MNTPGLWPGVSRSRLQPWTGSVCWLVQLLVGYPGFGPIAAELVLNEHFPDHWVAQRLPRMVGQEVLLRDIGDVLAFRILREEVVEWLVLARTNLLRDREPPLFRVVELGIDVEDQAAEREH